MYYILKMNEITILTSDGNLVSELITEGYSLLLSSDNYVYVHNYYRLVKDSAVKEKLL